MPKSNKGKQLEIVINNTVYQRYPIKTHVLQPGDKIEDVFEKYALPLAQKNDVFAISEKAVSIMQGNFYKPEQVKPGLWAKFLIKFIKTTPNDPRFAIPQKMQVAIMERGLLRILLAAFVSALTKPFGIKGLFYKIAGGNIGHLDGFFPGTFPPFDKYGVLAPKNPNKICNRIEEKFKYSIAIVDGNNIGMEILGKSRKFPYEYKLFKKIIWDNPQGQGQEATPLVLIRVKK